MTALTIPAAKHPNSTTAKRDSEGSKQTGAVARTRNLSGAKRRGRPPGAKNKPKSMVPAALADELLVRLEGTLPAEHYEYLKAVVKKGDAVSTEKELDILIVLLGRNLHPALIEETNNVKPRTPHGDEEGEDGDDSQGITVFRKDVTERLKVLNSLLSLRHQMEKSKDEQKDGKQPLIQIVADRNLLDGGRLGVLVGGVPGPVVGDTDGTGRPALPPRTVSSPLPE